MAYTMSMPKMSSRCGQTVLLRVQWICACCCKATIHERYTRVYLVAITTDAPFNRVHTTTFVCIQHTNRTYKQVPPF